MDGEITPTQDMTREEAIAGLREFADWLVAHPGVPLPDPISSLSCVVDADLLVDRARQLGGLPQVVDDPDRRYISFRHSFGPLAMVELIIERRLIGEPITRTIEVEHVEIPNWLLAEVAVPEGVAHDGR